MIVKYSHKETIESNLVCNHTQPFKDTSSKEWKAIWQNESTCHSTDPSQ